MREREGWRWFSYAPEDAKAAQAELNRLAAEGLELEEIWFCAAKFKHVEGRAPACWVEPARWTSMRLKDEEKQREYLELCEEAGWTLVDQSRSMFWFKASPGKAPAPIQTDGGVEWEAVLRGALRERAWQLMGLTVFWALHFILRLLLGNVHFWELFLSDSAMILMACLSIWLVLDILRGAHVLRYRSQCRRSAREGREIPVPSQGGARLRGCAGFAELALLACTLLALLAIGVGEEQELGSYQEIYGWRTESVCGVHTEYRRFGGEDWLCLDDYDCRFSWLARWIAADLRSDEGDQSYLERQYIHRHNPAELERADLGFDESWHYDLGKGQGLLLRQGNRVIRIEAGATLNSPDVLEKLWVWMEKTK